MYVQLAKQCNVLMQVYCNYMKTIIQVSLLKKTSKIALKLSIFYSCTKTGTQFKTRGDLISGLLLHFNYSVNTLKKLF